MRKTFLSWALLLGSLVSVSSCNSSSTTEQPAAASTQQEGTTTADTTSAQAGQMAYICPMECKGSASMQPGKCPVCGMDLVKNTAH